MAISEEDRGELLTLVKKAVSAVVTGSEMPVPSRSDGVFGQPRGCFVTLTNNGRLRGCIGTFSPQSPLAVTLLDMARNACHDPRFTSDPVTEAELPELTIKLSILTPLEKIDDPLKIQLGVHGIYITSGGRGGCFLPEVATDQGWNKQQFLSYCCSHKAGLPADAWRDPNTQVLTFTTETF